MTDIKGELKTYSVNTSVPKFNIGELSLAEIENEIEYFLFVEHEEDMRGYTHLRPLIQGLAKIMVSQADRAVENYQWDITRKLAEDLQARVAHIVYGERIETRKKMINQSAIDDEKVVARRTVEPGTPDIKPEEVQSEPSKW